ncbi:MAG: C40 family peptidase [Treponema sp.]|jgi:probable lipoprotein NlpC|nr:C40 family peptidase [Treponema sp.]
MKFFLSISLFFLVAGLIVAAPLESGYPLAPRASASPEEKQRAYLEARNRVIAAALSYENTPYRYGGLTAAGLDCSGFIYLSFKDGIGASVPRSTSGLYAWVEKIPLEKLQPGDLIFFKTDSTGNITHVGLYLGNRRFIHAASVGPRTGVIINTLDEGNWTRNYAGAGRAFPEAAPGFFPAEVSASGRNRSNTAETKTRTNTRTSTNNSNSGSSSEGNRFLAGVALAPTWNGFLKDGDPLRGFTSQLRIALDTSIFYKKMILGLEARPEYDGALGVFRLPFTLSWGLSDKFRIFAGPVISFGNAVITTEDGARNYSGGTSWFGTAGITAAPFIIKTVVGDFCIYAEAAWQSYFSDNNSYSLNADFSAAVRLSTGIRWTKQVSNKN